MRKFLSRINFEKSSKKNFTHWIDHVENSTIKSNDDETRKNNKPEQQSRKKFVNSTTKSDDAKTEKDDRSKQQNRKNLRKAVMKKK